MAYKGVLFCPKEYRTSINQNSFRPTRQSIIHSHFRFIAWLLDPSCSGPPVVITEPSPPKTATSQLLPGQVTQHPQPAGNQKPPGENNPPSGENIKGETTPLPGESTPLPGENTPPPGNSTPTVGESTPSAGGSQQPKEG